MGLGNQGSTVCTYEVIHLIQDIVSKRYTNSNMFSHNDTHYTMLTHNLCLTENFVSIVMHSIVHTNTCMQGNSSYRLHGCDPSQSD